MGRVLPSLTTRTGVISVADAVGTTKDQELQNALRRASAQREQARIEQSRDRMTPEGMLKLVGQTAQTVGQVTNAVGGVSSLIGKGLKALERPMTVAMRNAAAAKASKDMVLPQARKTIERVAGATGLGEGAPVTPETARMIQQASLEGPQGRVAAEALGAEAAQDIAMRAERGSAAAESDLQQRIEQETQNIQEGRNQFTPEMIGEAIDAELKAGATSLEDAAVKAEQRLAERAAEASMATDTAQRAAEQEAVGTALGEVSPVTRADEGEVQIDMFVESLGDTPLDRQEKLLTLAQGALTAEDQANILRAVDRMDIAPGPNVSDLFDPKGAYKRKLRAAMPGLGKLEAARLKEQGRLAQERLRGDRAVMKAGVQARGQDLRAAASKDATAQRREKTASQEEIAEKRETRYARQLTEKIRQFDAMHNYRWANKDSRERVAEANNKTRVRVAKIRKAQRGSGSAPAKQLRAAIKTGIGESISREKELARALRGTNNAVQQYKTAVAKEKQRIQERLANIRKYPFFEDSLDADGKTGLLVELEQSFENAQKAKTGLQKVGAQLRQASDKYKKLRSRLLKNPKDPDLIADYTAIEDELAGLLSTYQDLMVGVAEAD